MDQSDLKWKPKWSILGNSNSGGSPLYYTCFFLTHTRLCSPHIKLCIIFILMGETNIYFFCFWICSDIVFHASHFFPFCRIKFLCFYAVNFYFLVWWCKYWFEYIAGMLAMVITIEFVLIVKGYMLSISLATFFSFESSL